MWWISSQYCLWDLRDTNIVYVGGDRVVLVDFDWIGKDGGSGYPASLNISNAWAEGVGHTVLCAKSTNLIALERAQYTAASSLSS